MMCRCDGAMSCEFTLGNKLNAVVGDLKRRRMFDIGVFEPEFSKTELSLFYRLIYEARHEQNKNFIVSEARSRG